LAPPEARADDPAWREVRQVSGSELFWKSGTWLFFVGQLLVLVIVWTINAYQARKEQEARQTLR
jgi:hypothetical protein